MAIEQNIFFGGTTWKELVSFAVSIPDVPNLDVTKLTTELNNRVDKEVGGRGMLRRSIGIEPLQDVDRAYVVTFGSQMVEGMKLNRQVLTKLLSDIEADIQQAMRVTELTGLLARDEELDY